MREMGMMGEMDAMGIEKHTHFWMVRIISLFLHSIKSVR